MGLTAIFYHLIMTAASWLLSIAGHLLLIVALTILWRCYRFSLARQIGFLGGRQLRPAEARQAVLITGASTGIGLAVAKHLYKVGYSVIATYYDTKGPGFAELEALQRSQSKSQGSKRLFLHQLDITNQGQVREIYEKVARELDEHGLDLHALINNAGLGSLQPFAWLQRGTISKMVETNITGTLLLTRELVPLLIKHKSPDSRGRILFVSSGLGFIPGPTYATYGVTKCSQLYFSQCMNMELRERYGIQSIAIIPHNFIKQTNICASNVKNNQLAWDELKPIERELYARERDEHLEMTRKLEQATKELAKLTAETSSSNKKAAGNRSHQQRSAYKAYAAAAMKLLRDILASLNGVNLSNTIEESGALECFEDALRLRNPPEMIFAGDKPYQLIVGTLFLLMPYSWVTVVFGSVVQGLYR